MLGLGAAPRSIRRSGWILGLGARLDAAAVEVDEALELAAVEEDAAALGALVDDDAAAFVRRHDAAALGAGEL